MRKRLSTTLGALIVMSFPTFSVSAEELTIRWGTSPGYKPFIYKNEDGSLTGFDYEIGGALCAEMKAECSWVEQAWDGIIPGLLAKNYDAILGSMSITEERQKVIDFTGKYQQGTEIFVAKEGADFNDEHGELKGVKVGVQAATTHHDYMKAYYPETDIKAYPTQDEVWLDLTAGRLDAVFVGAVLAGDWLKTDDGEGFARFGREHNDPKIFGPGAGIGVRKGEEELRDKISAAILAIRENGEFAKINDKYFDHDIYGAE